VRLKNCRYKSIAADQDDHSQRVRERLQIAAQAAWLDYLKRSAAHCAPLRALVTAVATLDALVWRAPVCTQVTDLRAQLALAAVAALPNYCRPSIVDYVNATDTPLLDASGARHPVLETLVSDATTYVPNDVAIGDADETSSTRRRALVITGALNAIRNCHSSMSVC
jgi:DNA mismatch repair ATPase MutS